MNLKASITSQGGDKQILRVCCLLSSSAEAKEILLRDRQRQRTIEDTSMSSSSLHMCIPEYKHLHVYTCAAHTKREKI